MPSAAGSVHVTFEATVAGDWKATQLDESESANRKSLCAFRVTSELNMFVPENVFVPDRIFPPEKVLVVPEELMFPEMMLEPDKVFVEDRIVPPEAVRIPVTVMVLAENPPEATNPPATVRGSPDEPVWNSFR